MKLNYPASDDKLTVPAATQLTKLIDAKLQLLSNWQFLSTALIFIRETLRLVT